VLVFGRRAPERQKKSAQNPESRIVRLAAEALTAEGWTRPKLEDIELAAGRESMEASMEARIARIEADVALKDGIASARIWVLVFCFTLAAGLLGTMARGFGWI
jgi:hypothetical protein